MSVGSCNCRGMHEDFDRCYRAVQAKDTRFDGWFIIAVRTTGIYCRPSCPARPPYADNVRFYATAAAAERPDSGPASVAGPMRRPDRLSGTTATTSSPARCG